MGKLPLTVRRSIEVLGLCGLGYILVAGKNIIMPLIIASFLALLLLPVFRWLRGRGLHEGVAILLSLVGLILLIVGVGIFLSFQIAGLLQDIPQIQQNLNVHLHNLSVWIADKWNIPIQQQLIVINRQIGTLGNNITRMLGGAALSLSNVAIFIGLLPIYIFLILLYRHTFLRFIYMWFKVEQHERVGEAFNETEVIVKYYLVGLLIQITYLTVLVGGILMLFGIKHAILIGLTFGILNLIPYVGALIGNIIGVVLTLTSSQEIWQIWVVLGTIAFVQFLDNNILMPRIVGSKVKINPLASIVGIIIGGTLVGVPGMFMAIPMMAVLKIMFEKSPELFQWSVLLGEPAADQKRHRTIKASMAERRDEEIDKEKGKEQ